MGPVLNKRTNRALTASELHRLEYAIKYSNEASDKILAARFRVGEDFIKRLKKSYGNEYQGIQGSTDNSGNS